MIERRESARDKVIYGGVTDLGERGSARECIVRNISDTGASLEFSNVVQLKRDVAQKKDLGLTIARKGRSFLAKIVWWRDNFIGIAFSEGHPDAPVSDLAERLRQSEKKKRQLQRRIKQLIGEG
jgi:hypothetical protein